MKTNTLTLRVLLSIGLLTGCSDSFLDVDPQNKYLSNNFFVSEAQVFQGLIAAYDPLQWTFVDGRWTSTVMLGEIKSDNANAGGDQTNFDQPGWQEIDDMQATPLTVETASFWKRNYFGINKANQVLNNVGITSAAIEQFKAEARFLRAFYHFELFTVFGPIPVITSQPEPDDKGAKRNTLTEVFTRVTEDLETAIPLLPETYGADFTGRITKGAAQALLGKVYLYWADLAGDDKEKFDLAATQFRSVVESNHYALLDDYTKLFEFGAANTSESVFEIQFSNEVPADFSTPFEFINGNMIVQLCGIRGICSTHPTYREGWGFMLPTSNLYNSFLTDDVYRRDATIISQTELALAGCSVSSAAQNPVDFQGYWQQKYANFKEYTVPNGGEINVLKDANQPVIRYADVLLMLAEALVRGNGSSAEAMTFVDQVRERAKGPGNNTGNFRTAQDLMSDEGWTLLEVIWYERRAELAGEGNRWFDLVRSGRATASLFVSTDLRNANFDTNDLYLPIPQQEVDITSGGLTPYPDPSLFQ